MKVSQVIVVEGKNDIHRVKSAVNADVISTSGSGITKELLKMLEKLNDERGIIILTDPDTPGERIRAIISERIPTALHAFIIKDEAIYNNDVGIENASKEAIRKSLENLITYNEFNNKINIDDLIELRLINASDSKDLRMALCNELKLTYSNGKTLLKRLNMLNLNRSDLDQIMEGLYEKHR